MNVSSQYRHRPIRPARVGRHLSAEGKMPMGSACTYHSSHRVGPVLTTGSQVRYRASAGRAITDPSGSRTARPNDSSRLTAS